MRREVVADAAAVEQRLDDLHVAARRRLVQRARVVLARAEHARAVGEQQVRHLGVAGAARVHERRARPARRAPAALVDGGAAREQQLDAGDLAAPGGVVDRQQAVLVGGVWKRVWIMRGG